MSEPVAPDQGGLPDGPRPDPQPVPHAGLRYSALRLAVLLGVGLVLYLVGFRSWLLLLLALGISGVVSYVLLMRVRDEAAANLEGWVQRRSARRRAAEEAEDAELIAEARRLSRAASSDGPSPEPPRSDGPSPERQGQTPA